MTLMLPSRNSAELSLADVFPSCLNALGLADQSNRAGLPAARSAIVVLVDGLGALNLKSAKGHARFLADALASAPRASTVFPSTTAAALATLTTGTTPSEHGMLGYRIRDPRSGDIVNQLSGIGQVAEPDQWCQRAPLYAHAEMAGVNTFVVSHSRFADTALTSIIHSGATKVNANTVDDRVAQALKLVQSPGSQLVLLYVSELDETAHKLGVGSQQWAAGLELVDAAVKHLDSGVPADVGIVVTADHGVVDVPAHKQILYGDDALLMRGVAEVGGEPRGLQIYVEPGTPDSEIEALASRWRTDYGDFAWVFTQQEAVSQGVLGDVNAEGSARLGDILVIARKDVAFYDTRDTAMSGRAMIGQHGAVSDAEMSIPFIKLGAFAG